MKNIKVILVALLLGAVGYADAQYYYGPPPPPPPPRHRERQQKSDEPDVTRPSGYFEVSIGLAQPLGDFAAASGTGYHGYALPGDNIAVSLGLPINHSNFGIALMYSAYNNNYDYNSYVGNIQYADQTRTYYIPYDAYGNNYDAGASYTESFIMAGLYATIPIQQRLSFDFRLMGGIAICSLPEIAYGAYATSATAANDFFWDISSSTATGFAVDAGADIRYKFRRASIMAGVDFISADPSLNTTLTYQDQYGGYTYTHLGGSLPISAMSFSIGIGYQIF